MRKYLISKLKDEFIEMEIWGRNENQQGRINLAVEIVKEQYGGEAVEEARKLAHEEFSK